MRKVLVFLTIVLGMTGFANGQKVTGRPCAEYDQFRDISGMREIILKEGVYYDNLRRSYAEAINFGIGKNIVSSSKTGLEYILDNTKLLDVNFVIASDYQNGVRYGNSIGFTSLAGQPSDKWAAFSFEGNDYIYAKVSCMNPQKPKVRGCYKSKGIDGFGSVQKDLFIPNPEINFVPSVSVSPTENYLPPVVNLGLTTSTVRTKTWFGKNWGWIAGAVVASGITTYFLTRDHSVIGIRTMPPGQPSLGSPTITPTNPAQPGLPSDPRSMPDGIGMMKMNNFIQARGFGLSVNFGGH